MIGSVIALRELAFTRLYTAYGAEISLILPGSGLPYLGIEGAPETVSTPEALVFNLEEKEIKTYSSKLGIRNHKFIFFNKDDTDVTSDMIVLHDGINYEIVDVKYKTVFKEYRLITKRIE